MWQYIRERPLFPVQLLAFVALSCAGAYSSSLGVAAQDDLHPYAVHYGHGNRYMTLAEVGHFHLAWVVILLSAVVFIATLIQQGIRRFQ